jgi:hypothetical protein
MLVLLIRMFSLFSSKTPLHLSAEYGHGEMCRLLLQHRAEPSVKDNKCQPFPFYVV